MRPSSLLMAAMTVTVAACATSISPDEVKAGNLTISEFVESRFLRGLLPFQKAERKTRDGGVLHNAFFNERNFYQLAAPAKDLKTFCEAKGGKFVQLASSKTSAAILATPALSKNDVFYQHWENYQRLGFSNQLAGLTAAYEADLYERAVTARYPESVRNVLAGAQRAGAFGTFSCELDGKPSWLAAIEPVRFNPQLDASNILTSPSLTLFIKGESLSAKNSTATQR